MGLVLKRVIKLGKQVAGAAFNPGPPQIHHHRQVLRRRRTGQLFAQQQPHHLSDSGLVRLPRGFDLPALIALVQRRFQIVANTFQVAGTDGFNAGAFGGFENRPRALEAGAQLAVCCIIMMGKPQRRPVSGAAKAGPLLGGGAWR